MSQPNCPYRGLFAFREEDAPYFYGRDTFADQLVTAVQRDRLVAVLGPSGSGKSSVVFAGLVPRLRRLGGWQVVGFRPGNTPFNNLATTLTSALEPDLNEIDRLEPSQKLAERLKSGKSSLAEITARLTQKYTDKPRLLLIVDQFEETYTLTSETATRESFLDVLLAAVEKAKGLTLLLTLRADFLSQALAYPSMTSALQRQRQQLLGPMTRPQLEQAITQPANQLDVEFEAGLVERILDDVGHEPGNLPLLEFALTELWDRQTAKPGIPAIGIPPDLYQRLYQTLLTCGPFSSDDALRAIFVDSRLSRWRFTVPEANNPAERVDKVIANLHGQWTEEHTALIALLHVLESRMSEQTHCSEQLSLVATTTTRLHFSNRAKRRLRCD